MKKNLSGADLAGVFTAIVTPFTSQGQVDWPAFEKLVEFQIEGGVAGIVPCGTTGESPTLSESEQLEVIKRTVELVRGRCLVVAGTGSNNTAHAVSLSRHAEELGADALLVVNPYYNKPTQEGLFRHFQAVADSVEVPVVLYNIKGRTGVNVETATLARIVETCPNVLAVKEASGDLAQMREVLDRLPKNFSVLSGDDNLTLELIKMGGRGVVSVASNLIPREMVEFVNTARAGDYATAQKTQDRLDPLFTNLFVETNPIPVKTALAMRGQCQEAFRLPLCELRPQSREVLTTTLKQLEII